MEQEQKATPLAPPSHTTPSSEAASPVGGVARPQPAKPVAGAAEQPQLLLPPSTPPQRSLPGCNRWTAFGCLGVIIIIVIAVLGGVIPVGSSFGLLVERARSQVRSSLPADLAPAEQARTHRNLDQLPAAIEQAAEPSYAVGRFLGAAGEALEDRQLTIDEVERLNLVMEELITGAPVTEDE